MAVRKRRKEKYVTSMHPNREYLAGGALNSTLYGKYTNNGGSTLGTTNDDIVVEFGYRIYNQMMADPQVSKCVNLLKVMVLGDAIEVIPSLSDNHPEYENALQVSNFCSGVLNGTEKPLRTTLYQMLDALIYGYKIAEVVYKLDYVTGFEGKKLVIDKIKVKPFGSVRFIVDGSFNILGFAGNTQYHANNSSNGETEELIKEQEIVENEDGIFINIDGNQTKFYDKDKFIYLTIGPADEDPRGRSVLRPAFNSWYLKTQIYPEYLRYLLTCSIPMLVGFTPESDSTKPQILRNPDGTPVVDNNGKFIEVSPVESMREALMQARNSTVLAMPGGSQIKEIYGNGSGIPFYKSLEVFDQHIEGAILYQTLATSEGRYQNRAASQVHMSVLDQLVWWYKGLVIDMISGLLKNVIKYNFGDEYVKYLPMLSLGDTERREFAADAASVATLYAAGYMSEDQKRFTDAMLGFPVRDSNYDQFRDITPTEALQVSKAALEQAKLEAEIKKMRQAANLDRVDQLVKLKKMMAESGTDASGIDDNINKLIQTIVEETQSDSLEDDENRILKVLINAGSRAREILAPEMLKIGDENRALDGGLGQITGTSALPKRPASGVLGRKPYISVKSKPTTF